MPGTVVVNVDDHEAARYARTRVLRQAGFEVHEAGTGGDALRVIEECHPDIVLLDVNLPDVNGIEVCREIKAGEDTASVIVLQISASAITAPHATAALNVGADAYLTEPVDPDVLIATIRAMLRLRNAERALSRANEELSQKNNELHELNESLRRSNEDLEHFAYVASHDLQEPLRNISTYIQLLERTIGSRLSENERTMFGYVVEGAQRMMTLIRDVLAYSRAGKDAPHFTSTDLGEAVDWAMQNLSEGITEADAVVIKHDLPAVTGDPVQLRQVFQNLIGNSIKYRRTDDRLHVDIAARRDDSGDWRVEVRDNGIGIAEPHLERVFRPFKRLHGADIPGSGIGLALCRRIIESHGGRIWAEAAEGHGTRFVFTLKPAMDTARFAVQ